MPGGQNSSTGTYVVIDAESLTTLPPIFAGRPRCSPHFSTASRWVGCWPTTTASAEPRRPRSLRERIDSTSATGHTPLRGGGCSLIAGDVSPVRDPGGERDVVLVRGRNAAATVKAVFPS